MPKFFLILPLLILLLSLFSCAHSKPKSTAKIYSGDAPTINYSQHHDSAGGSLSTN
ncbi:MAG: hypothetical protein WCI46_07920 [Verrucomicrobiota bacterium]